MLTNTLLMLIGCVCLLHQVANAAPLEEDKKLEACLREVNSRLAELEVQDKVKELEKMAIDNGLNDIYMLDLVGSSKDNLEKVKQVYAEVAKDKSYLRECLAFDDAAMSLLRSFECEPKIREASSVIALNNQNILGPNNAVNKINRYRMACIMMMLSD